MSAPLPASASYAKDLTLIDTGAVREILKPDMLVLDGGRKYRLDNIRIPADNSQATLDELNNTLLRKTVHVYTVGAAVSDRYGVPLVQAMRGDGGWVQGDMVSKGFAWAFSSGASRKMMLPLMRMEATARGKRRGFWSDPAYAVRTPDDVGERRDSFQVVEGKILDVTIKKDYAYLNFGGDWKKDFTINMQKKIRPLFGAGFTPEAWKGRKVRIRGWVESRNGPMIELTYPEQIELLEK